MLPIAHLVMSICVLGVITLAIAVDVTMVVSWLRRADQ
jgi:hypothetical protein